MAQVKQIFQGEREVKMKSFRPKGCKNCGGDLYFNEEDKVWKCIQCEHPAEGIMAEKTALISDMTGWSNQKKGGFYKEHKDEILVDYESLGVKKMLEKWQMSSPGWFGLRKRWGIESRPRPAKKGSESGQGKLLNELEWLRGYRQAVLDILTGKGEL